MSSGRVAAMRRRGAGWAFAFAAFAALAGCGSGGGGGPAADAAAPSTASAVASAGDAAAASAASSSGASTADATGTGVPTVVSASASTAGIVDGSPVATPSPVGCDVPRPDPSAAPGPGLRSVCRNLWLDTGYAADEEPAIVAAVERAARRILDVFQRTVDGLPIVVMCRTPACVRHFTGSDGRNMTLYPGARAPDGAFAAGARTVTIVTAPTPVWLEQILAHEFSHHELYGRLAGRLDRVPPWFNEGLATLVGRVPSCVPMPASPVALGSFGDQFQWNVYTAAHPDIALAVYCAAARELDAWLVANGRMGLLGLIDDVAAGAAFGARYGPMFLDRAPAQLVLSL